MKADLKCDSCGFSTASARLAVQHVQGKQTHVVSGTGSEPDTTITIEVKDLDDV
jgi:NifU-like protein involved in Fe-S cluster formation